MSDLPTDWIKDAGWLDMIHAKANAGDRSEFDALVRRLIYEATAAALDAPTVGRADDTAAVVERVGAPMTLREQGVVRRAYELDAWAKEWNSLPTAIDRLLADRAALAGAPSAPAEDQGGEGK